LAATGARRLSGMPVESADGLFAPRQRDALAPIERGELR
jgi:hypothetical protein